MVVSQLANKRVENVELLAVSDHLLNGDYGKNFDDFFTLSNGSGRFNLLRRKPTGLKVNCWEIKQVKSKCQIDILKYKHAKNV